jgi:hypothetical protein
MSMSFSDLYVWLSGLGFPDFFAIWTWLTTVPWWLAIATVVFIVFAVRITWNGAFYFLNWLFDWTFRAGVQFGEWLHVAKKHMNAAINFGKLLKQKTLTLIASKTSKQ